MDVSHMFHMAVAVCMLELILCSELDQVVTTTVLKLAFTTSILTCVLAWLEALTT